MTCILIDDEPLAREGMIDLVNSRKELVLLQAFKNAIQAQEFLTYNTVDLIFLDIEMPGINGLQFAESIPQSTLVIFATAYKEYAYESYTLDAIGYLLKPILQGQFDKAVDKALSFHTLLKTKHSEVDAVSNDFLFIKSERRYYKILFDNILFIEGLKDYVIIYTTDDKIITAMNLKTIHSKLPQTLFIRVSKSYIVNHKAIQSFDTHMVYIKSYEIPIGKVYQEDFYQLYIKDSLE